MDKPKQKKLTPKQKKFAKEYQKDLNGARAAKAAGYSPKSAKQTASEILTYPNVKEAINKDLDATLEKLGINAEYILGGIKEVIERSMQAKPVFTKMGEHAVTETDEGMATAYQFESSSALKGFELLGKYQNLSIWKERVEHSGDKENPIVVTTVDLDERVKQIKGENGK